MASGSSKKSSRSNLLDKDIAQALGVVLKRKLSGSNRAAIARTKAYLENGDK